MSCSLRLLLLLLLLQAGPAASPANTSCRALLGFALLCFFLSSSQHVPRNPLPGVWGRGMIRMPSLSSIHAPGCLAAWLSGRERSPVRRAVTCVVST